MNIRHDRLQQIIELVFSAAGSDRRESRQVARHLVEANLCGHDSHGVIRVSQYIRFVRGGTIVPNRCAEVVDETDVLAVVDGQLGYGQVIGEEAMQLGVDKARRHGVAMIAVRNAGHLGRIGHYAHLAAVAGFVSLHFVNSTGYAILVAPFGGIDRRLSSNPLAAGFPVARGEPIVLDFATSAIAEGKLKVARNRNQTVPAGCIIDADGNPTSDPAVFYAEHPGAILPFGGHKGYGLSLLIELLAGAVTGSGCSNPDTTSTFVNGMLSIVIDPARCSNSDLFADEVHRFIEFIKSSRRADANQPILMPGELEQQTKQTRLRDGIDIDDATWQQFADTCRSLGITDETLEQLVIGDRT